MSIKNIALTIKNIDKYCKGVYYYRIGNIMLQGKEKNNMDKSEIQRNFLSKDTKEMANLLESLDDKSLILATIYLSALADVQRMSAEKTTISVMAVPPKMA